VTVKFDPAKDAANLSKHGLSLSRASDMAPDVVGVDDRFSYGEIRYRAFGTIDGVPHCLVFTVHGEDIRAISLRRAHLREYRRHVR
jgi:uncharacterized DUF497 family protein